MKILVFGATGPTGQQVIRQGLELGYEITAFVRDPARLAMRHPNLAVIRGDVLDSSAVSDAVLGHDVTISALGNGKSLKGTVFSAGTKNIVDAMNNQESKRLIMMSAFGVGNSLREVPLLLKIMYKSLLKNTFADKAIGEQYLKQSNVDWTLVHPVTLTNGPKTAKYKTGERIEVGVMPKISRADVADFMLKLVADRTSIGRTLMISY